MRGLSQLTTITAMCGPYKLSTPALNHLLDQFAADMPAVIDYRPRYNIAPTPKVLAVRQVECGPSYGGESR